MTDQQDSNWAGYVVASSATTKTSFSSVSGGWTQPAVDCEAGFPSHSAFWVGLGGYSGEHLEQTGTSADCSASGQVTYYAWYELVPAAEVLVKMTVQPGDRFSAHVAVSGDTVTISLSDLTRHTTFSKQLQMSSPTVSSAEWIAEAPSAVPVIIEPGLPHPLTCRLRHRHVHRRERVRGRPDRLDHRRPRPGQRARA